MVSHLFFYQLVLIALVWLCLMLQWAWPSDPAAVCPPAELPPLLPKRKREPKPFAGLTQSHPATPVSTPPPPPASPRSSTTHRAHAGRRRQVDTSTHFCPNPDCRYHGWSDGQSPRQWPSSGGPCGQAAVCGLPPLLLETLGTLFHGKRVSVELIVRVIACLAEGLGIRGTRRVFRGGPQYGAAVLVEPPTSCEPFRVMSCTT